MHALSLSFLFSMSSDKYDIIFIKYQCLEISTINVSLRFRKHLYRSIIFDVGHFSYSFSFFFFYETTK